MSDRHYKKTTANISLMNTDTKIIQILTHQSQQYTVKRIIENSNTPQKICYNKFNQLAGHKINIQKSFVVLYTNNEECKEKIEEIPFTNSITKN